MAPVHQLDDDELKLLLNPGAKLVLMMLESTGLLGKTMKTSERSVASFVLQVVAMDA